MLPPFWMKWLAKVCRRPCAAWPFGSWIVVFASARRNEVMAEFGWPYCFQCWQILASSSAVIGTERTFPLLVPLNVITPLRRPVGLSFSASDHRAPVARQISVMISTCGLSQGRTVGLGAQLQCRVGSLRQLPLSKRSLFQRLDVGQGFDSHQTSSTTTLRWVPRSITPSSLRIVAFTTSPFFR